MGSEDSLRLEFSAEARSVGMARAAVAAFAAGQGMKGTAIGDVRTVVTEACSNVVKHAYPGEKGTFEVEAHRDGDQLAIVVRDFGRGMRAQVEFDPRSRQLGLGLISTLASRLEILKDDGGTELRMRVPMVAGAV